MGGWGRTKERVGRTEKINWKYTITICKIDSKNFLCDAGEFNPALCDNLDRKDGEGDGRRGVWGGEAECLQVPRIYMHTCD